ncbi:MAG: DUF2934 domain-containing protein [Candidatus Rokuibacteriota bacterium]
MVNRPVHAEIARRAYDRYLSRGRAHGADLEDWLEAERQVATEGHDAAPRAPRRRGPGLGTRRERS